MKLSITHTSEYRYSNPIRLQPHWMRLIPRHSQRQTVEAYKLEVDPLPSECYLVQGFEGSLLHHAIFEGDTTHMLIKSKSTLTTHASPLNLHLYPHASSHIPFAYSQLEIQLLKSFLDIEDCPRMIRMFTENVQYIAEQDTLMFLMELTKILSNQIIKEYREFGWPYPPSDTLKRGIGSCRDIAVLFIACARYAGIAARFVSGYIFDEERAENSELHAWVEVYLPGAGWWGYDPTYGVMAGEYHVDISASAFPELCAPIEGSFAGYAEQQLTASVVIQRLSS